MSGEVPDEVRFVGEKILVAIPQFHNMGNVNQSILNQEADNMEFYFCRTAPNFQEHMIKSVVRTRYRVRDVFLRGDWDYLLFFDDDLLLKPDTLKELFLAMKKYDVDIASGVYFQKQNKELSVPIVYQTEDYFDFRHISKAELEQEMLEVPKKLMVGFGMTLLKRKVAEMIQFQEGWRDNLDINTGCHHWMGEDCSFMIEAYKAGFRIALFPQIKAEAHFKDKKLAQYAYNLGGTGPPNFKLEEAHLSEEEIQKLSETKMKENFLIAQEKSVPDQIEKALKLKSKGIARSLSKK